VFLSFTLASFFTESLYALGKDQSTVLRKNCNLTGGE